MTDILRGRLDNLALAREALEVAGLASRYFGISQLTAFRNAIYYLKRTRLRPKEAFDYGYLAHEARVDAADILSKRACVDLQKRLNSPDWFWVTEDKGIFQQYCEAFALPAPRCFGLLFKGTSGVANGRPVEATQRAWTELLETIDLSSVVIKPCRHSRGKGLVVPDRASGLPRSGDQEFRDASSLAAFLFQQQEIQSWIIQDKVRSHNALVALSGTAYLQTLRLYTFIEQNGEASVLAGFLRVIAGPSATDNFQSGASGNLMAPIELATGTLIDAAGRSPEFRWSRETTHPQTHESFTGFQIPDWDAVLELVRRAALAFRPVRCLAWDVAITPQGPLLIEANIRWDPPNHHPETIRILREALGGR